MVKDYFTFFAIDNQIVAKNNASSDLDKGKKVDFMPLFYPLGHAVRLCSRPGIICHLSYKIGDNVTERELHVCRQKLVQRYQVIEHIHQRIYSLIMG